jgi:HAMP domain-containing protein
MGIRLRFILIIGICSLLAAIALAFLSYQFTVKGSIDEAKKKGTIVSTFIDSSRMFYRKEQRPLIMKLVDKDRFYPNLMSGFALTRGVWDEFEKNLPGYRFKQATLDPLYAPNKADADEIALIAEFNRNKNLKTTEGILEKNGEKFLYFARPIKIGKGCLRCHGDPADAPKDQIEIYGSKNGYHWTAGTTVSAFITYVPIQKALDTALESATVLFFYGLGGIVLLTLVIWFSFDRYVVTPITKLEHRASEISLGKNLGESTNIGTNDEIGSLSRAIDRMRISVVKMLEKFK